MIDSVPRFLQGTFAFSGQGLDAQALLHPSLVYTVPADKRAQLIYLRAGNASAELISLSMMQDGKAVRLFPVGAKAAVHVPLAVVEDLQPGTHLAVFLAAPEGIAGQVVVDIGLIEI